jgi:putative tricarboxylic transport membrane protein
MAQDANTPGETSGDVAGSTPVPAPRIFNFNSVVALLLIAAAIIFYFAVPYQIQKPRITFGINNDLDPEVFPQLVAIGLFIIGTVYFFVSFRMTETNGFAEMDREAIINVSVTIGVSALYVFVIIGDVAGRHIGVDWGDTKIGFFLPSAILIFVLSTFYGNRNFVLGILVSLAVPAFIYLIFTRYLLQSLPESPEMEWLYREAVKPAVEAIRGWFN